VDILNALSTIVGNIGLPVGLVIWGAWFVSTKLWPDHVRIQELQAHALDNLASALTALAEKL
jgi:hypothetical protein